MFASHKFPFLGKKKVIKKPENPEVEEALYTWFLQQRKNHVPISTDILRSKARYFYEQITGKNDFLASSGWLDKFKLRHGIRFLKVCGERISSNVDAVKPFQEKFLKIVNEMNIGPEQIYNADESALFWRVLPNTTWVHQDEKSAPGRKISKDRITFMPCCNATGTHKLPLLVIGKAQNPRAFKNCQLPVTYRATSRGWMTRTLFSEWFKTDFVPEVKKFLHTIEKPQKALLLIDNAPSHPQEEISSDPNFKILFLPPNCTALIQPMDQNLIQNVKVAYRKKLLTHVVSQEDGDIITLLKQFSLKEAVINLDFAWKSITENNVLKSWSNLWPLEKTEGAEDEDDIPLATLQQQFRGDIEVIKQNLRIIDPNIQLTEEQVTDWATGKNEIVDDNFFDEDLIEAAKLTVIEEEEEGKDEDVLVIPDSTKIKHSEAIQYFSYCIQWAEENNIAYQDILLLKKVQGEARDIHVKNITQKKMEDFFKPK